jgi:hypothetical protein
MLKGFIDDQDPRQQHYGLVKQVWKGCVDWVAPENVEAWKRGCEARAAEEGAGGGGGQSASSSLPTAPPIAAIQMVRGRVEVKVKGTFGDKWIKAACEHNHALHEFSSTDSKGKQQRVTDCWVVDVPSRSGKRQHRFDIDSDGNQQPIALAAESAEEKQRWMVAVETKEALRARQAEQALMAKHDVSTIEEARKKEAEVVQRQKEEQQRRMEVERLRREAEERQRQEAAATRAGWATQLDANSGKQFWAHVQSGASQWDVPTAAQLKQQEEEETARRKEAEEQALMAKYGVNTIEEARRKKAEFGALMAKHGATHGM